MQKIIKKIKENKTSFLIAAILFIIPLFWFKGKAVDFGGDSSRLYFYDAASWIKNISLYSTNQLSGVGINNPSFFMLPFLAFVAVFQRIGLSSYLVVSFFDGLLLAGSFISMYCIIGILADNGENENDKKLRRNWAAIIGSLFFVLSPVIYYEWANALYYLHQIFIYPLVFLLLLKYILTDKRCYFYWTLFITFFFAVNFSLATVAWVFAFFPLAFLFLFFIARIYKKKCLKKLFAFSAAFALINAFHLLPQIMTIIGSGAYNYVIFSEAGKYNRGLNYFLSIAPHVNIIFNLLSLPQYGVITAFGDFTKDLVYTYGIKFIYLGLVFPVTVILGIIFTNKKKTRKIFKSKYILSLVFFIFTLFLMTAKIGDLGMELYKSFFSIPGFAMFRSFYSKFNLIFVFFYAILLGLALRAVLSEISVKKSYCLIIFTLMLMLYNGFPLLSGKAANRLLWQSKQIKMSLNIGRDYEKLLEKIKNDPEDGKYLTVPLTNESYQLFAGEGEGAYFGPSSIPILAGKQDFPGLGSFSIQNNTALRKKFLEYAQNKDFISLNYLLSFFNIKYIFHNADDYIYENFPYYPYSTELKALFKNQDDYRDFIEQMGYGYFDGLGDFNIYSNEDYFLPKAYSARNIFIFNSIEDIDYRVLSSASPESLQNAILIEDQLSRNFINENRARLTNVFKPDIKTDEAIFYIGDKKQEEIFSGRGLKMVSAENFGYEIDDKNISFDSSEGKLYLNNLSITPKSNINFIGTNLIKNGSFEESGFWSYNNECGGAGTEAEINWIEDAADGNKSLMMLAKKKIACTAYYLNGVKNDYIYRLSFNYRKDQGGDPLLNVFINDNLFIDEKLNTDNVENNKWSGFERTIKLDKKVNNVKIFIYTEAEGDNITKNLFDNFKFIPVAFVPNDLYAISDNVNKFSTPELISFKKIYPTKYKIRIHGAKESFLQVFSNAFDSGWKVYVDRYSPDQAQAKEGVAGYVSKKYQGAIQDNNLFSGHIWDTWFKNPIFEESHLMVNGYANSWWIDLNKIKESGKYIQNPDDSIDFDIIVEFWPQRLFYLGTVISILSLISIFLFDFKFKNNKKKNILLKKGAKI